jgi:DNA mismatch repair ATPase MutS
MDYLNTYKTQQNHYQALYDKENQKHKQLSIARLICIGLVLWGGYFYYKESALFALGIAFSAFIVFLILVKRYDKVSKQMALFKKISDINTTELRYVNEGYLPFEDGSEFINPSHSYSYDLDVFGKRSLFQHINRTANTIGKEKLAHYFLYNFSEKEIIDNQKAIAELKDMVDWRQCFYAIGQLNPDSPDAVQRFLRWTRTPPKVISPFIKVLCYLIPLAFVIPAIAYIATSDDLYFSLIKLFFGLNLCLVALYFKQIREEVETLGKLFKTIENYGQLIQSIENQGFESEKLRILRGGLLSKQMKEKQQVKVSTQLKSLSVILARLSSVENLVGSLLSNGSLLYHVFSLFALYKWKANYAEEAPQYLSVIAEFETLNSLANFSFNNPEFVFPSISPQKNFNAVQIGHPLLNRQKRISTSLNLDNQRFIILTGSNMSGKSTFLRTVGSNLVLAKMGSPVCAQSMTTYPFEVRSCMRVDDSLQDNDSYFYAELKRLKGIVDFMKVNPHSFILLDEILRGTNSNDKQAGTIALIEQLVHHNAIGIIATHDLEVCNLREKHPTFLANKCFEVEILDNNLHFDYQLREGVCKNKSAYFLMKKMGIIH